MVVEAQVTIQGSRNAVWAVLTDIEHSAKTVSGIEHIEIVEKPASGLVGMRWRETRLYVGKPATVEKRITDAADNEFYKTKAEMEGFMFLTTMSLTQTGNGVVLTSIHESGAQGFIATLKGDLDAIVQGGVEEGASAGPERHQVRS